MNRIPIVLASDKRSVSQLYTTMLSILTNKNSETFYDIFCLIPQKFTKNVIKQFKKLISKYKNVDFKFIVMKNAFPEVKVQIQHITLPTFYRLKIAELLPQYDKAIYLDIDTIVLKDLSELYNINLASNLVGGVRAASYVINENKLKDYYASIGIKDMCYYINAGVTLWNLAQIRKENLTEKFIELSKNQYRFMDQDIINLACYGRIQHIDCKFNVITYYKQQFLDNPILYKKIAEIYGEVNLENAINNPVIVHYASDVKPWINKNVWLGHYWGKYARKTPIKNKQIDLSKKMFLKQVDENKFKKVMFWGASLFLENLILSKKVKKHKILGIIDRDSSKSGTKFGEFEIVQPEKIKALKPDVIIFAIKNNYQKIYPQVKEFLEKNYPEIKLLPNAFNVK